MPRRYEKEIEEILDRDEKRVREAEKVRSVAPLGGRRPRQLRITSGHLMAAGVIAIALALVLRFAFVPLAAAGALLLVAGYLMHFAKPRAPRYEKRWRGEIVDYPDTWSNRLRRFFRHRR